MAAKVEARRCEFVWEMTDREADALLLRVRGALHATWPGVRAGGDEEDTRREAIIMMAVKQLLLQPRTANVWLITGDG